MTIIPSSRDQKCKYENSSSFYNSLHITIIPFSSSIDVGGQVFQTTKQTLTLAGSNTLFSNLFNSNDQNNQIPFVDRDLDLFSILLSVSRTGNLPSKAKLFDIQDIIFEAQHYGIDHLLVQCQSNPSQFEALNLEKLKILNLGGATDFSGLQIIDLHKGLLMQCLNWENLTKSSSTVQAIGKSPEFLFTSFESGRRNSNSIMVYDVADGFRTVSEIARNEILKKCHIDKS
ncbi:putative chromatin remodeling & transcription regulator BTB-POZ family [Helianthus anomalus]